MAGVHGKTIVRLFIIYSKKQDERFNTATGHPRLGGWPNLDPGSVWLQLQHLGGFGMRSVGWMQ